VQNEPYRSEVWFNHIPVSYNLHITRAKRWPDSKRHPIGADEWLTIVAADPELTLALNHGPCFAFWNLKKEEK